MADRTRPDAGRTLHDIDVQDGLVYASYWNDGLVVLDVGNGMKGGRPDNPQLVSQFKYDLDSLYSDVEARWRPGLHSRHAHGVAARELRVHRRRGVRQRGAKGAKDASAIRARTAACR